jgi:hypothetical protein
MSYASFMDVEHTYPLPGTSARRKFDRVFARAAKRGGHFGMFGSSLQTIPTGFGSIYVAVMNAYLGQRFGNVPGSQIAWTSSYGGGQPPAAWLVRGSTNGHSAAGVAANFFPPTATPFRYSSAALGPIWAFQHDAGNVHFGTGLSFGDYVTPRTDIHCEIYAGTVSGGPDSIAWSVIPLDQRPPNYFRTVAQSGTVNMGLNSATWDVKKTTIGPLAYAADPYTQVIAKASGAGEALIIGARFINKARPEGITVTSMSSGGYRAQDILASHGSMGECLRAFNFDGYMLCFGANDAAGGVTAAQFHSHLLALMAQLRSWHGNPSLPFILISDAHRENLTAPQQTEYDLYPSVLKAIAKSDPYVLAVNSRRAMHELGHNSTSESMAGLVNRSAWSASSISYVVNDYVTHNGSVWKCYSAHTSSAGITPGTDGGAERWDWHRRHFVTVADGTHFSTFGNQKKAMVDTSLILSGCFTDTIAGRSLRTLR